MKNLLTVICAITLFTSCGSNETKPIPTASFDVEERSVKTTSTLNVFNLDNSNTGIILINISLDIEGEDIGLMAASENVVGVYTRENSIPGDYTNRISLCKEEEKIDSYCMSSNSCNKPDFQFEITEYNEEENVINGTFEGAVCNKNGKLIVISNGYFENIALFPNN